MTMALRRPHQKSRHGCRECKRRRVKCDEARPSCSNCQKRRAECEYGSSTSLLWANEEGSARHMSRTPGSDPSRLSDSVSGSPEPGDSLGLLGQLSGHSSIIGTPAPTLKLHDLELMMQWSNATYRTLSRGELTDPVWKNAVPEEGLAHPFLMHGILALSALHLARTNREASRHAAYLNRAVTHQNQALVLFRELLCDVNENNAKAMFAFASIVVVYTFGFPHTPDVQDPWTCIDDLYQILVLTRGIQQVIRPTAEFLSASEFAPILQVDETHASLPEDAAKAIRHLREANDVCHTRDAAHEREIYTATIDDISEMLSWVHSGTTTSVIAGRWAIKLPSKFLDLLRGSEPLALVMLAYYGALLHYLRHRWCFDEWCVRIAKAVWAILDDQWRPLVHWAMREILGEDYLMQVVSM